MALTDAISTVPVIGPYDGKLSNGGEKVELAAPGDEVAGLRHYIRIDRINYSDGAHPAASDPWPTNPDGQGASLRRINTQLYGNDPANWQSATPTPGT